MYFIYMLYMDTAYKHCISTLLQDNKENDYVGFDIVGGKENPLFPGDNSLFVSHVALGGPADGKLRCDDLCYYIFMFCYIMLFA